MRIHPPTVFFMAPDSLESRDCNDHSVRHPRDCQCRGKGKPHLYDLHGGTHGAADGDTIMVAPGTYHEQDIDFLGKAITVMSTDPGDSAVVATTVVDANSLGGVFIFQSGEESNSVLTGLTITGGSKTYGGGIYCDNSSLVITNNMIPGNTANQGSGIFCEDNSSPAFINNIITENSGSGWNTLGGGIVCSNETIVTGIYWNSTQLNVEVVSSALVIL